MIDLEENEEALRLNLDLLEEKRENAIINIEHSKQRMEKYCNRKVRLVSFEPEDHVLMKNELSKVAGTAKMASTWEGPYTIREVNPNDSYVFTDRYDNNVPLPWHASYLNKCYI
ncbi:hypothetical protein CTI12_AA497830 [Artemisia annua]|uniref:Reverse transcriptase domain-containing protein n=1 Tax=Artemisia annua TaxID=35608 RepID=A0A2U1LFG6_ARTAN|nr:hypothetical protein CTI12_AA497830 [Artemisia annua]